LSSVGKKEIALYQNMYQSLSLKHILKTVYFTFSHNIFYNLKDFILIVNLQQTST